MSEYIGNPLSGKLRGVTYEDGKITDVHIRDTDDVVKVFVPVRHGRWLCVDTDTEQFFLCNICKKKEYWESDYCPNCGADMRGINDE